MEDMYAADYGLNLINTRTAQQALRLEPYKRWGI